MTLFSSLLRPKPSEAERHARTVRQNAIYRNALHSVLACIARDPELVGTTRKLDIIVSVATDALADAAEVSGL